MNIAFRILVGIIHLFAKLPPINLPMKSSTIRYFLITLGILLLVSGTVIAQGYVPTSEDTLKVYEGLFSKEEPLDLTLRFDIKEFRKTRRAEKYQPGEMTCTVNDSFQVTNNVRVKARGIWRRDNCSLPPIMVNIKKSGIEADSLKDVGGIKMVVRCRPVKQYQDYVLREYLVYKIYNLFTPVGYRVRLVRLRLIDTGKDNEETVDWAFLQEPDEVMEKRLEGRMVKSDRLSMATVNREMMDKVALFQYMIGNGDYSVTGRHNLKVIALQNPGTLQGFLVIPYDFDYTGLVNASYAVPGEDLGIATVRERYFLGPCRNTEVHEALVKEFATYEERIIDYINNFEFLDGDEKEDMIEYITSYFREAERDDFVARKIQSTCRSYQ
jgi:hypothetical protein